MLFRSGEFAHPVSLWGQYHWRKPAAACGLALGVPAPARAQLNAWAQPSPGTCRQRFLGVPLCLGHLAGSGTVLAKAWTPAREQRKPGREWIPCVPRPHSVPSKPPSVWSSGHGRSSGQPGCREGWAWRPRPSSLTTAPFSGTTSVCWLPVCRLTRLHPRPLRALPSGPVGPLCIPLRHRRP